MTWRRRLVLFTLANFTVFQKILIRLNSLNRQMDWQIHQGRQTDKQLIYFFDLLKPVSLDHKELARFGSVSDGGYVIKSKMLKGAHVVSLGVGDDVSFDLAVAKVAKSITLYDHTVQKLPHEIPNSIFIQKKVVAKVVDKNNEVSLEEILNVYTPDDNVLLKIDIEGYEWEILPSVDWGKYPQVTQVVIEFHGILKKARNFEVCGMVAVLTKLRANFEVINFHPNNYGDFEVFINVPVPDVFEVTLMRKVKLSSAQTKSNGNMVNSPNNPNKPEIYFPLNNLS